MKQNMKKIIVWLLVGIMILSLIPFGALATEKLDNDLLALSWEEVPVYNGSEQTPEPKVTYEGKLLTEDVDYVLDYSNNIDAGNEAKIMVTGIGRYTGLSLTDYFVIQPKDISTCEVDMNSMRTNYMGVPVKPSQYSVYDPDRGVALDSWDYSVIFTNNVDPGQANALVIGEGNYTGYVDAGFQIIEDLVYDSGDVTFSFPNSRKQIYIIKEGESSVFLDTFRSGASSDNSSARLVVKSNGSTVNTISVSATSASTQPLNLGPGNYTLSFSYSYKTRGYEYVNGTVVMVTRTETATSAEATLMIIRDDPVDAQDLQADLPITQGSDRLYLHPVTTDRNARIGELMWTSTDPSVASVEDGKVTLHKAGEAKVTATLGDLFATWDMSMDALDISRNTMFLGYDPNTGKALVTWKNEVLDQDEDYTVKTTDMGEVLIVEITGINLFGGTFTQLVYKNTGYPYVCKTHAYTDNTDMYCNYCGYERTLSRVDIQNEPSVKDYGLNEKLDLTGGTVVITYSDGSTVVVPMSDCRCTGDLSAVGRRVVYVYYGDNYYVGGYYINVSCKEHKFFDWEILSESSCEDTGLKERTCMYCGFVEQEEIPLADHWWSDWEVEDSAECEYEGEEWRYCNDCYEEEYRTIPATGHTWGDWKVVEEASKEYEGLKVRSCKECGAEEEETIPKLSDNPFTDVPDGKYYTQPILWALEQGITTGKTATTFEPNEPCTRGQIVTFLWRAMGEPEPDSYANPFTDVKESAYYYKAVLWAYYEGITTGKTDTTFEPKAPCTRCQVVTFLWRTMGKPSHNQSNPFSDIPSGKYYTNAVLWALENGITTGKTATTFLPNGTCTRAQIVTFLYRTLVEE